MNTIRSEKDSTRAIDVPADKLWGAQTQRLLEHFRISTEKMSTSLAHALVLTKRAAAKVNEDLGLLSEEEADVIWQAVDEVLAGQHDDEFPPAIWQTGSGMQSNMNINKVLANWASESFGGVRGTRRKVHPNDDVNKSQSSSDIFSTAMHVAALLALREQLILQLKTLTQTLSEKSRVLADIVKTGRTYLQDVTPLILGQGIFGWVVMLEYNLKHIEYSLPHAVELVLGGTAVGAEPNTHPEYACCVTDELVAITCVPFVTAPNKSEALAVCDALVQAHDALKGLAASLVKIANDVRWLASGPRCGTDEISIPENEPGSSIMSGKVNPTQCEALTVLCCRVVGNDVTISMDGASGNFELNVLCPTVIYNSLQSVRLLADGMESFNKHCAVGIEPNRERINQLLNESLMLVTALNTHIGYNKAAEIVKKAHRGGLALEVTALVLEYPSEAEFDRWVRPEQMVGSMKAGGQSAAYKCSHGMIKRSGCACGL